MTQFAKPLADTILESAAQISAQGYARPELEIERCRSWAMHNQAVAYRMFRTARKEAGAYEMGELLIEVDGVVDVDFFEPALAGRIDNAIAKHRRVV